jgi:hypothetical protein
MMFISRRSWNELLTALYSISERIYDMPTQADLDAAIAGLKQDISDAGARITAKIADLEARLNAGMDPSQEIADLKAASDAVKALGQDQTPTPAPTP